MTKRGKLTGVVVFLLICVLAVSGCGKKEEEPKTIDLEALCQDVRDEYGEEYNLSPYDAETLENLFGITQDMVQEYVAEGPLISLNVNHFIAIHAAEGKADQVEEALNNYRDYQINEAMQYPVNIPKLEASQVVRHGDYVFYVLLGSVPTEMEEKTEDVIRDHMTQEVQRAVDIINGYFE